MLFKHGIKDPYWTFEIMYTLEKSLGVKSTCYFLHERGKAKPLNLKSWIIYGRYNLNKPRLKDLVVDLQNKGLEIECMVHKILTPICNYLITRNN
jgi:hypothetical protein